MLAGPGISSRSRVRTHPRLCRLIVCKSSAVAAPAATKYFTRLTLTAAGQPKLRDLTIDAPISIPRTAVQPICPFRVADFVAWALVINIPHTRSDKSLAITSTRSPTHYHVSAPSKDKLTVRTLQHLICIAIQTLSTVVFVFCTVTSEPYHACDSFRSYNEVVLVKSFCLAIHIIRRLHFVK